MVDILLYVIVDTMDVFKNIYEMEWKNVYVLLWCPLTVCMFVAK